MLSNARANFVFALKPDRSLYTNTLIHRTQILYSIDISFVIGNLGVRPGITVVETGTGSGSLTYSLMKALGGKGHLFSFEYNKERAEHAQREFKEMNANNVTIMNRDAYKDGFLIDGRVETESVDAIFLDLPSPWLAVPHVVAAMKRGGR